jgi:NADH:ubiquinone oxidoreductase subunit 4 (subunit M)
MVILKTQYTTVFLDLSLKEFFTFLPLILGTAIVGVYPNVFLTTIHMSVNNLVELLYF